VGAAAPRPRQCRQLGAPASVAVGARRPCSLDGKLFPHQLRHLSFSIENLCHASATTCRCPAGCEPRPGAADGPGGAGNQPVCAHHLWSGGWAVVFQLPARMPGVAISVGSCLRASAEASMQMSASHDDLLLPA
jgi:hypothetical protein